VPSSAVQVKGLNIGRVNKISLTEDGRVKVIISVSKKIVVTDSSSINLTASDLLGTKVLQLDLRGSKELEEGAVLPTHIEGGILDNLSSEISPLINDVRHVVATLDTVLLGVNSMLNEETKQRFSNSVASLEVTMNNFSSLSAKLNAESAHLTSIIKNANSITENLAANNQQITNIIHNAEGISNQLKNAPIEQTVKDLQTTVAQLQGVMSKINSNEGSLGLMVNDKQLYNNLSETLKTLNLLIGDINAHPSRYINVTIFGKKNKDTH
jgi:phospholipid/cholesterol/gamma-HCH transport system substrate-binding protein